MTEQQTPDREKKIAEIREALEKATPGPWKAVDIGMPSGAVWRVDAKYNIATALKKEDADFVANAPEWLRFLLDELDRKDEENHKLREQRDAYYKSAQFAEAAAHGIEKLREENRKMIEGLRMCLFNHGCWREEDYVAYMRDILKEIGVTVEWQKSANDMRTTR